MLVQSLKSVPRWIPQIAGDGTVKRHAGERPTQDIPTIIRQPRLKIRQGKVVVVPGHISRSDHLDGTQLDGQTRCPPYGMFSRSRPHSV